eukprot:3512-Ditylum_brightwellii.AAC.1
MNAPTCTRMVIALENDNKDGTSILESANTLQYRSSSVSSSSTGRSTIDDDGENNGGSGSKRSIPSGGEEPP